MAWTTPRTWQPGELVTAALLNTHVRDNFTALFSPALTAVNYSKGSSYSYDLTTWQDVDAGNLAGSITLNGSRLLVMAQFLAGFTGAAGQWGAFDVAVDGTRLGDSNYGLAVVTNTAPLTLIGYKTGLSAGAHSFKLQYRSSAEPNPVQVYGAYPVRLWALEV